MKLAHIELGPVDAPALVFLHGFLGSAEDWRPTLQSFERDFRCVSVDLPGHGHSVGVSPEDFTRSFHHLLNELHIGECGLIGYSLGGRLAMHFALKHPEIVEFLVLESASPGIDDVHERVARHAADEKWAATLECEGLPRFLDAWYAQPVFASLQTKPQLLAEIKARRSRGDTHALAAALRIWSPGFVPSLWHRLPLWRAPLLFVAGESDAKYVEIGKRVADLCPRASLHIVRNSGHVVHEEQPDDFLAALRAFPMIGN